MKLSRSMAYFPAFARGILRNPLGIFMALIFPVILILIFGSVFSVGGTSQVPLTVQNLDGNSAASQQFLAGLNSSGFVTLSFVSPEAGNLSGYLTDHELSAGLVIPSGFGAGLANRTLVSVIVYTNPASASEAGIVQGAVQGVANGMNLRIAGGSTVVSSVDLHVGSHPYKTIDYLVPGLIGFSILVSPMFSMVNLSSAWKRDKLFRQLSLTPLTRTDWLFAALLWYVLIAVVSAAILVTIGRMVFGAEVMFTLGTVPFLILGPILFVSIGLLVGSVAKAPETAGVVGNVITFPMMFLSGTFFPISMFPSWLVPVARCLPLYYIVDGLNATMIYNDLPSMIVDLGVVVGLVLGLVLASTHVFTWREERGRVFARAANPRDGSVEPLRTA